MSIMCVVYTYLVCAERGDYPDIRLPSTVSVGLHCLCHSPALPRVIRDVTVSFEVHALTGGQRKPFHGLYHSKLRMCQYCKSVLPYTHMQFKTCPVIFFRHF